MGQIAAGARDTPETLPLGFAPTSTAADSLRFEVRPPALFNDDDPATRHGLRSWLPSLSGMRDWLNTGWQTPAMSTSSLLGRDARPVAAARQCFLGALGDVDGGAARDLGARARSARSLRELWHLRNELFTLVAVQHCEIIAQARLAALNRWFPMRDPGPGRYRRPGMAVARHDHHLPTEGIER